MKSRVKSTKGGRHLSCLGSFFPFKMKEFVAYVNNLKEGMQANLFFNRWFTTKVKKRLDQETGYFEPSVHASNLLMWSCRPTFFLIDVSLSKWRKCWIKKMGYHESSAHASNLLVWFTYSINQLVRTRKLLVHEPEDVSRTSCVVICSNGLH